ncbi:MAG: DUF6174 domain-containing protein [Pirellulales bacterium]
MNRAQRRMTISQIAIWLFLLLVLLCLAVLTVVILVFRDNLPPLTQQRLDAAAAKWSETGPADYDMELELTGARSDKIRIEVRADAPQTLAINGRNYDPLATPETWTVDGQFGFIERDVESAENAANKSQIQLSALFHPKFGVPMRYRRSEQGQPNTGWRVKRFQVVGK